MTTMVARNIGVKIGGRAILDGVGISVEPGRVTGLIGPNGAGKTTLVRALAGLQEISGGEVMLDGEAAAKVPRAVFAQQVAYLPQGAEIHWPLTVERLVALGRLPHLTAFQRPADPDQAAILRAMKETDVTHLADRTVTTLSGGERGRVMIARALAGQPQVLLADEPVAATIRMDEQDFHDLIDKKLGIKEALFKGKLKISGGMTGANNAWGLAN